MGKKIIFAICLVCSVEHGIDERTMADGTVASHSVGRAINSKLGSL
jgi:hypothetical protein